jgi:hypothetical protein
MVTSPSRELPGSRLCSPSSCESTRSPSLAHCSPKLLIRPAVWSNDGLNLACSPEPRTTAHTPTLHKSWHTRTAANPVTHEELRSCAVVELRSEEA